MNDKTPIKKQHNASVTVTCICWLQSNKDSFNKDTWKQAWYRFNSENNTQISAKTFREAAKQLNIRFRQSLTKSTGGVDRHTSSSVLLAKLLRLLVRDIEKAVGDKVISQQTANLLTMFIGKKSISELDRAFQEVERNDQ